MTRITSIIISFALLIQTAMTAKAAEPLNLDTIDTLTMLSTVVISTEYDAMQEEWLILSQDCNGHVWAWYADDGSWLVGDGVNLLLQDVNDTPQTIYDDAVVMVHFERYDLLRS